MAPEDHGDHGDSAIGYVTPNAYTKPPTRRPERARLGHRDIRPGQARSDATYLYSRSARRTAYTPVRGTVPIAPVAGSADAPDEELPPPADEPLPPPGDAAVDLVSPPGTVLVRVPPVLLGEGVVPPPLGEGVVRLTPNPGQVVGWSGCQRELAAFVL